MIILLPRQHLFEIDQHLQDIEQEIADQANLCEEVEHQFPPWHILSLQKQEDAGHDFALTSSEALEH